MKPREGNAFANFNPYMGLFFGSIVWPLFDHIYSYQSESGVDYYDCGGLCPVDNDQTRVGNSHPLSALYTQGRDGRTLDLRLVTSI